jgi:hypothetical protein
MRSEFLYDLAQVVQRLDVIVILQERACRPARVERIERPFELQRLERAVAVVRVRGPHSHPRVQDIAILVLDHVRVAIDAGDMGELQVGTRTE